MSSEANVTATIDTNESPILTAIYIIFSILMIIFTILLIIIYSRDKYFQGYKNNINDISNKNKLYLSYFNIFFCCIIVLSNLIRLIPESLTVGPNNKNNNENNETFLCKAQAFIACLLDKALISLMTNYSIFNYLSMFKSDFYKKYLKRIYLILISIGFLISIILSIIFIYEGISVKDIVCSIHTRTTVKKVIDSIFTSILLIINVFCLASIIKNLYDLSKKYSGEGNEPHFKRSSHFLYRYTLDLIINIIAFTYTLLVINKAFPRGSYKDFIYISICLIVELFFTINESLFKAFIRLVTCGKYYKLEDEKENEEEKEKNNDTEENFIPETESE